MSFFKNLLNLFRYPENLIDLTPDELEERIRNHEYRSEVALIDVRTTVEYKGGHIHGAMSFPLGSEEQIALKVEKDRPVILICKTGHRSQSAAAALFQLGFQNVSHLKGGMDAWRKKGKPTVY
ncbi:rhodanese-like domain-containing protein [Desulfosporosinus metallidurans]|uniref:Rhodanese/MoeB/ThiF domain protein n=1 Tax=Desulfosporosinus metallidurans TaxID=1888891 RepID=A0A1Q8QMV8_9FIRM|nr:rhodanese-like domain-containing protein [Desulfosporosinus metallidurans]OLN28608.1 rhodanese/MoeB/ThiF domain protein [Desulfosporosinus metallidurans]